MDYNIKRLPDCKVNNNKREDGFDFWYTFCRKCTKSSTPPDDWYDYPEINAWVKLVDGKAVKAKFKEGKL